MIKVQGHSNFYKKDGGVIVNTDYGAFKRAKERKKEKQKVNDLEARMDRIESMLEVLINNIEQK